jgi:hypothetical protein
MNREILNIVKRSLIEESKNMCEQCGSKSIVENECMECGYMKEMELGEKLHGKQHRIDKNKNGRIDREDFKLLRRKKEMKERLYGNQHRIDKNKNNKIDAEDFKMLRKESLTYKLVLDESTNEIFYLKENEMINIIENIVLEEKKNKKTKVNNVTKSSQDRSKKENDNYINSVMKKMKEYLKGGSKGEYEMEPKNFPKGNGELEKMAKMAYVPSETAQEYIENFTAAGLENLDYDEIHPNEDWVEKNIVGSSITGNNPKWGNAVETEVGERRNKIRKNNLLGKVKRDAYQKDDQPIRYDRTGEDLGDTVDQLLSKYSKKESKPKQTKTKKNESFVDENKNIINEEINIMKNLINYNQRTQ